MAAEEKPLVERLEALLTSPPRGARPARVLLAIEHAAAGLSDEAQETLSDLIEWLQEAERLAEMGQLADQAKGLAAMEAKAEEEMPDLSEAPEPAAKAPAKRKTVERVGPPKPGSLTKAVIFTDGGARGNPGPAAIGIVMETPEGERAWTHAETIGKATNNVAEYRALIAALEGAKACGVHDLDLRLDAELIVKQMTGDYRVKNKDLKPLWEEAQGLLRDFDRWRIKYIPRKQNETADALVNQALDEE